MAAPRVTYVPIDADAERQILASLLTSPATFDDVSEVLSAEDFGVEHHSLIYSAIVSCDAQGKPIDSVTVADELRRTRCLAKAGGTDTLRQIVEGLDPASHPLAHTDIVRDKSLLRSLLMAGREIASSSLSPDAVAADTLEMAESRVFDLGNTQNKSSMVQMPQAVAAAMAELAKVRTKVLLGHPTGFSELDRLTGGFQGGQLITLAARPGMGKSAFALQMATHIASTTGLLVPFLSYEMSVTELTMRILASRLRYDLLKLRQGEIPSGLERDLAVTAEELAALPLLIDDNPPPTVAGVRSSMRRLARRGQVGAIFVDYLQLMEGDRRFKDSNRTQEVSEISRGLKRLASDLNVPVIALSQLNRQLETRPNKRPMLSDLRESGSIEQDSSLVMFLYREHVYNPSVDPEQAEIVLAKQRNGPSGINLNVRWQGRSASFYDQDTRSTPLGGSLGRIIDADSPFD